MSSYSEVVSYSVAIMALVAGIGIGMIMASGLIASLQFVFGIDVIKSTAVPAILGWAFLLYVWRLYANPETILDATEESIDG